MVDIVRPAAADVMPRFFFHVHHGSHQSYIDHIGVALPDSASVWRMASTCAGESIRDLDGNLKPDVEWCLDVRDEDGRPVCRISLPARAY